MVSKPACMLCNIRGISSRAQAIAVARLGDEFLEARSPTNCAQVVTSAREPMAPALPPDGLQTICLGNREGSPLAQKKKFFFLLQNARQR